MVWLIVGLFALSIIVARYFTGVYLRTPAYDRPTIFRNQLFVFVISSISPIATITAITLAFLYTDYGWWALGAAFLIFIL